MGRITFSRKDVRARHKKKKKGILVRARMNFGAMSFFYLWKALSHLYYLYFYEENCISFFYLWKVL
jgi:hypothetical protein